MRVILLLATLTFWGCEQTKDNGSDNQASIAEEEDGQTEGEDAGSEGEQGFDGKKGTTTQPGVTNDGQEEEEEQAAELKDGPTKLFQVNDALLDVTYSINATSLFGVTVCEGEVQLKVNPGVGTKSGSLLEMPKGELECILGQGFDLREALGSYLSSEEGEEGGAELDFQDSYIALKQMDNTTYSPSRPFLPGFLSDDPDVLTNLSVSKEITLTNTDPQEEGTGISTLDMLAFDVPYSINGFDFPRSLTFKATNTGFDTVNKVSHFIFDSLEVVIALEPLAVPRLELVGKVTDLAAAAGEDNPLDAGGGAIGDIIEQIASQIDVNVVLELKEMKGLNK